MTSATPSTEERRALGAFLVNRRARLKPDDAGLRAGRRRTLGLRREEVALLAGVSVSWYTWLEQGRDIRVSAAALQRIAQALQLDPAESAHVFALASQAAPFRREPKDVTDSLATLVRAIDPVPAYVRNSRLDILVWNTAVAELFVDYGALPARERNTLRLLFLYPPYRTLIVDWEELARGMLDTFRAARARATDKAPFDELADELNSASEEFRAWWKRVDVRRFSEGNKRINHPQRGLIHLSYAALTPEGRPELSLVTYVPIPGPDSAA